MTKKALKSAGDKGPPTAADLESYLDQLVTDFENAIIDQHAQMFLRENTDGTGKENSQAIWLDQGTQLALKVTEDQLAANMEKNMVGSLQCAKYSTAKSLTLR